MPNRNYKPDALASESFVAEILAGASGLYTKRAAAKRLQSHFELTKQRSNDGYSGGQPQRLYEKDTVMMRPEYNPSSTLYNPKECGAAMIAAVEELAAKVGEDVSSFEGRTLTEVFELADKTYDELPEFWQVWKSWHAPQPHQDMGDL